MDILLISNLIITGLLGIEKIVKYCRKTKKRSSFKSECCGAKIEKNESYENNIDK